MNEWEAQVRQKDPGYNNEHPLWAEVDYDTSSWGTIQIPGYIEEQINPGFEGFIWLRREIDLPDEWLKQDLKVELNQIDDDDITFFNGHEIGRTYGIGTARHYAIPRNLLKKGKNILTIRLGDTGGNSGIPGDPSMLYVTNGKGRISLAENGNSKSVFSIKTKYHNNLCHSRHASSTRQYYTTECYIRLSHSE